MAGLAGCWGPHHIASPTTSPLRPLCSRFGLKNPSGPGASNAFRPCLRQDLRCWMLRRMSNPRCEGPAARWETFAAGRNLRTVRSPLSLTSDDYKGAVLFGLQKLLSPGAQPAWPENWSDNSTGPRDQRHKLNGCEPGFYERLGSWVQAGA